MRIGLYLSLEHGRRDDMAARLRDLCELVRTARDAGFELLLAGQHFLVPQFQYLQPVPVLARIVVDSGDMEIGTDILQLPLLHPVQVAETVATLDQVCGGRFTLGVGLGYRPVEYESLGIRRQDRLARFIEGIDLIRRLWTEDRVTFRGEHFRVEDVSIAIRPAQAPRPPILVAATGDRMVRRAATLAGAWKRLRCRCVGCAAAVGSAAGCAPHGCRPRAVFPGEWPVLGGYRSANRASLDGPPPPGWCRVGETAPMPVGLTVEQRILRESAERFFASSYDFATRQRVVAGEVGFEHAHWRRLVELGWTAAPFAPALGGLGLGLFDSAIIMRAIGASLFASPYFTSLQLAGRLVARRCATDRARELLAPVISGHKQREQFGRPIGKFQAVQHRLVDIDVEHDTAEAIVFAAAEHIDRGASAAQRARLASSAKAQVGWSGQFVGEEAVQLHGAIAMTNDLPVGHYLKRLTAIGVAFGDSAYHVRRFQSLDDLSAPTA